MKPTELLDKMIDDNRLNKTAGWWSAAKAQLHKETTSTPPESPSDSPNSHDDTICFACQFERLEAQNKQLFQLVECLAMDCWDTKSSVDELKKSILGK